MSTQQAIIEITKYATERLGYYQSNPEWYDNGTGRVVINDGEINVYSFSADRARHLVWQAHFSGELPVGVVTSVIREAAYGA